MHVQHYKQKRSKSSSSSSSSSILYSRTHNSKLLSITETFSEKTPLMEMTTLELFLLILFILLPVTLYLLLTFIICPKSIKIPIKDSHVFISGGSSGIGLSLAQQAASEGARVSILARDLKKLQEAQELIKISTGVEVAIFSADVRDFVAVEKAVEEAGQIDVLICNHGVFIAGEMELQETENVKMMIDVNLMGTFNLIKAALPGMKMNRSSRGPASIALMSSQAGQSGIYGFTAYSSTKFALRGLGESLHLELLLDNIHVTIIFPPNTETPGLVEDSKRRPEMTRMMASYTPEMTADEVAKRTLAGIKSGTFLVHCNALGFLMCLGVGNYSPQRSPLMAFFEVIMAGFVRLVSLGFLWHFNGVIAAWSAKKSKKN